MFLSTFCNPKTPEQKSTSDRLKEQVVAFELPGMKDVIVKKDIPYQSISDSTLNMDIYYPPNFNFKRIIPAVIIVYGFNNESQIKITGNQLRNWSVHISWCKIIAASGMAAIVYETVNPENDLISLLKYINSSVNILNIDPNNIGAYTCSANSYTALAYILNNSNGFIKCAVVYYGMFLTKDYNNLSLIDSLSQNMGFMSPILSESSSWRKDVPLMIVNAGIDDPLINQSLTGFVDNAINQNLPITVINYPNGLHGFDFLNDNDTTRMIISSTIDFWKFNLK
jgi:dienelactone hydrolase